ncbi:MAG: hypothetical protein Q7T16_03380 [Candidatus Burarchaeum sp.]|nr:hypothetical protein [Candidatus Burarchaeum sp.]MDO8339674.1 hypothetical protein [Candidatus Burarchaeum sp.]
MVGKHRVLLVFVLLAAIAISGCVGSGNVSLLSQVQQSWIFLSLLAVFTMYLVVGILYMFGTGFGMPGLIAWCKTELFQITATAIMVGLVVFAITGTDAVSRGLTSSGNTAMEDAQEYMLCQSQYIWSTYNYIIFATAPVSILYSSTIHIRPLKMGFSLQPAKFLQPIMDNVNIAITMLASATWASKLIYQLLLFAQDTMLKVFLPLGVLFRAFPMTRSIGGALIAIAIALYIALPAAVLISSVIYQERYDKPCLPIGVGTGTISTPASRIVAIGGGWTHYAFNALSVGAGGTAPAVFGKLGGLASILMAIGFGGWSIGILWWVLAGALVGMLTAWMLAWAREIVFLVVILGFVGMVIDYMITFTFARELGKILGADVNLSALMKIL